MLISSDLGLHTHACKLNQFVLILSVTSEAGDVENVTVYKDESMWQNYSDTDGSSLQPQLFHLWNEIQSTSNLNIRSLWRESKGVLDAHAGYYQTLIKYDGKQDSTRVKSKI